MYTLRDLIRASGYAGTSGQSFRNNVAGAASGAKMSDYKCNGWAFSTGGTAPDTAPVGGAYDGTQTFDMDIDFTQGSRASYIKRTGAMLVFDPLTSSNGAGYEAHVVSQSVVGAASGSHVQISVTPPYATGTGSSITKGTPWYVGYTNPSMPPAGMGTMQVRFFVQFTNGTNTPVVVNTQFQFSYTPDIGPFNPTLVKEYINIPFHKRLDTLLDYDIEYHANSTYTSLAGGGVSFDVDTNPGDSFTYWIRYRLKGSTGSWTNLGSETWHDARFS